MADEPRTPLVEPPFPVARPSLVERVCWIIPILGWIVARALQVRRLLPWERYIDFQIFRRTAEAADAWGNDPTRRQVAAAISEAIRDEFGWSNAHYLPDDRMDLLWWSVGGNLGGEAMYFLFAVERQFGVKLSALDADFAKMTLGQFVDHV